MDKIHQEWLNGKSPGHYMFGKIDLEKKPDFIVDILPFEKYPFLNKVGKLLKINFLDQQIRVLFKIKKYDLIYAPFPLDNTRLLTLLKYLNIIKIPIIVLGHQNLYEKPDKPKRIDLKKIFLLEYEMILFLSKGLMNKTKIDLCIDDNIALKKFSHVNWGAEQSFYKGRRNKLPASETQFAICAGTTDRDFNVIIEAFRDIDFPLEIYCTEETRPNIENLPSHISINSSFIPYSKLLVRYQLARFILIPIKEDKIKSGRTLGLTVLLDALAIGKPAIMTQNDFVDINPGALGFGISIYGHEVQQWKTSILGILNDFRNLDEMGLRATVLFEKKYNSFKFGEELAQKFSLIKEQNQK